MPALGTELKVNREYLDASIDRLTVLGVSLVYLVMRKLCHAPEEHAAIDSDILNLVFTKLREGRFEITERIADIALPSVTTDYDRLAIRVNRWIALKKRLGKDAISDDLSKWDVSALEAKFRLAQLVLLEDESAVAMAQGMFDRGELTRGEIQTWPLFDEVRPLIAIEQSDSDGDGPSSV